MKRNFIRDSKNPAVPLALLALLFPVCALAQTAVPAVPKPTLSANSEKLAAERAAALADHQQMMDQLGIKQLRPPASHDPKSPNAVNYDEAKANPYPTLPDPLILQNGQPVSTPEQWWKQRRPQIVELFDREVLGRVPANAPKVYWKVLSTEKITLGGVAVVEKHLAGEIDNSSYPALKPTIDLVVGTPAAAQKPVPLILELAFSPQFLATIAHSLPAMLPGGPGNEGPSWQEQALKRGWGYAVLLPTSFQEDNGAGLRKGVIGLVNKGQYRKPEDWGTIRAWAWGASRVMDYLETDARVDAHRVAIEGHSRFGKTALVTMAYDQRFVAAYISSAGTGGDKLYRHVMGEQLENLTAATNYYYWMAGNFLRYGGPLTTGDLPVDAHELIALCAPRPVLIGVGSTTAGDAWADPKGEWLGAVGADPVYRLLRVPGLGTKEMPPIEHGLTAGKLAFRQHRFGHTPGPNWPTFLDFAAPYLEPGK